MAIQLSTAVRDAKANQLESTVGTEPLLRVRTGAQPANCAAARTGTILAIMTLPSDWIGASSGGVVTKVGTWEDLLADAGGTIGHFEIMDSTGTTCHQQGTVTVTGGGGDMTVANLSVAINQPIRVTSYTSTEGNA